MSALTGLVSIHAPGRGATRDRFNHVGIAPKFQFTHPGGVRQTEALNSWWLLLFQFTHPGGVRRQLCRRLARLRSFNSRTREGCDGGPARLFKKKPMSFNSRTREGCDTLPKLEALAFSAFQFTHPGGVRRLVKGECFNDLLFQFTHPGGVRLKAQEVASMLSLFQFTHPGGVRHPN